MEAGGGGDGAARRENFGGDIWRTTLRYPILSLFFLFTGSQMLRRIAGYAGFLLVSKMFIIDDIEKTGVSDQ